MQIDITKLVTNISDIIHFEDTITIPENLLVDSRITSLKNVTVSGDITLNENNELVINGKLIGTMNLKDDITLEPVDYDFNTDFEETLDYSQNIIDITDILWQNIVVEIPSKVRATSEDIELSGDGWRVISEDTYNKEKAMLNNPFTDLAELLKTKEDK